MTSDRRVLITGAAQGIGLAIARAFAGEKSRVHICDIDVDALRAVRESDTSISTSVCDISDRPAVARMMGEAIETLGGLDVLVNNTGIAGPTALTEEIDPDEWDTVLAVNLTGTFNVTRLAIPHLKASGAGVIIVISSIAGKFGYPGRIPYAATKWGLIGFTKTLSMELGEANISVNAILPGAVEGPRLQSVFDAHARATGRTPDDVRQNMLARQSIKRLIEPENIASLALFLATDSGRLISGQAISIDGDAQALG